MLQKNQKHQKQRCQACGIVFKQTYIGDKHGKSIAQIKQSIAEEACKIINDETAGLDSETGGYNAGHLWKVKNKIIPKLIQVPTAMEGPNGNLLTDKEELKEATLNHYKHVLRNREIYEGLEKHKTDMENLCE